MTVKTADFLIIGGGVMGIALSLDLARRYPDAKIILLEKEQELAAHASGRNSGVLHAGFYYSADSLKARFTRDGNRALHAYCDEKGLRINKCGKLVVCQDENETAGLLELLKRGQANKVRLEKISEQEAKEIEPRIKTHDIALWSPDTASVDPIEVVTALSKDALQAGVIISTGTAYIKRKGQTNSIQTSDGIIEAGYVVNAAGLYADQIASDFGFSKHYKILPFKGLYLYSEPNSYKPKVHIYPVPDLQHPFLGVHFTLTVDGQAKIGPTAIPAFWRENYQGLAGFKGREATEILFREMKMWLGNNFGFRELAWKEMKKYKKSFMIKEAEKQLENAGDMGFSHWGKPGIRAQLVDLRTNKLEMDFIYEGDQHSFHLLNAVSPAFTCSLSIANYLGKEIAQNLS